MKTLLISTLIVCLSLNSFAYPILLYPSPEVSRKERESFLKVESKKFISFSKNYINLVPDQKNIDLLLESFEQAQKYYLVGNQELALQFFNKAAALKDIDDWKDPQRKMIFASLIRMAELDPAHSKAHLKKAMAFGPNFSINEFHASSQVTKQFQEIKSHIRKSSITWPILELKKDFSFILINGRTIDLNQFDEIKIPQGTYRLTYLSDIYKPQTYQVTAQQIPLITPSRIPFAQGTCQSPKLNQDEDYDQPLAVYYSTKCIQYSNRGVWSREPNGKNLRTSQDNKTWAQEISSYKAEEKPFYQNGWFWVLAGSAVAGVLIYSAHHKKKSSSDEPPQPQVKVIKF